MFSSGSSSLMYEDILKKVSESEIIYHYLGVDEIPCVIKSPIRQDQKPSFGIFMTTNGKLGYKDFSTHETGGLCDLLSQMWGIPFVEVVRKIESEMSEFKGSANIYQNQSNGSGYHHYDIQMEVRVREWRKYDLDYWESFGISMKWLKFANVHPISHKMITKNGETFMFGAEKHAYVFVEHKDGKVTLKIYQPFSKDYKWSSNIDRSVWSLWTKLPEKGKYLIISSSLKDCLNIWANTNIPAICMQGEGYLPKPKIMEELKSRFRNIIVLYDNDFKNPDNPGRTNAVHLCRTFGLQRMEIPERYGEKDPSDLYRRYGKEKYMDILKEMFKNREYYGEQEDKERKQ